MDKMKSFLQIVISILLYSCSQSGVSTDSIKKSVYVISHQQKTEPIDLSFIVDQDSNIVDVKDLNFKFTPLSGEDIIESIEISPQSDLVVESNKMGIAHIKLTVTAKDSKITVKPNVIEISVVSQFLLDFTQSRPMEVAGSVSGVDYPTDSLVQVSGEIIGVDSDGKSVKLSPGLLVNQKVAAYPHNSRSPFPDFNEAVKYYGYKENGARFNFRYQPIIPMLEVGDGKDNRGVGIIVINKNQIMNDPNIEYEFEGYCSIRTHSDDKETYNLGVVVGTINNKTATLKDVVVARDYFNIGYSSSGQIYSKKFNLESDDYLTINIVGEAGIGRDKNRTIRFEYIKISPILDKEDL